MMKHINCPNCGCKLFDGDEGSHIILKCCKSNNLFEVKVDSQASLLLRKVNLKNLALQVDM